ncbi:hypothetical protein BN938_1194 [Mucinivorans hirudinis]|uniref:DUF2975 domain-containing protein n=1 Tax=Mucinivorans hirudinis TaxID=1433126 RepID=A0A060RBY3_9BACT|nr:hypothetical protein BN938_1194 [Mucinivorans hirudinis]
MKNIDKILSGITKLYYVLVGIILFQIVYITVIENIVHRTRERSFVDMIMNSQSSLKTYIGFAIMIVLGVLSIWIIIIFFKLISATWRAVKSKNIFDLGTAALINRYAVINLVGSSLTITLFVIFPEMIDSDLSVEAEIGYLSTMVICMIFARILRIGYILKQEQDLTI